jgi:hypothetical protein
VALKIIGAGYGRTGTLSVHAALERLGLHCYHMVEVLKNPHNRSHLKFWCRVANSPAGASHNWEQVFSNYSATLDFPACCVWRELMAAYPDAKVLLTLHPRGAEAWYESALATVYRTETMWQYQVIAWFIPFGRRLVGMTHKLIWQRTLAGTMANRLRAIERYRQHIAEVKAAVPAERLLVFSADQGWKPLCDFVEMPVPDVPFPRVNDRAEFGSVLKKLARLAYVVLALAGVAVVAAIYLLARRS